MKKETKKIVRLILLKGDQILLIRKLKKRGGHYALIGGKVDKGETPVEAMIREAYEEAGLLIRPEFIRFAFHYKAKGKKKNREFYFFQCLYWKGKIEVKEPEKFSKLKWHSINQPPQPASPRLIEAFKHIQTKLQDHTIRVL